MSRNEDDLDPEKNPFIDDGVYRPRFGDVYDPFLDPNVNPMIPTDDELIIIEKGDKDDQGE